MLHCDVSVANRRSMYVEQIIAGYILLEKMGQIRLQLHEKPELKKEFYHDAIIETVLDHRIRIVYDLTDGYNNYPSFRSFDDMLDQVDILFKASCHEGFHSTLRNRDKIVPLAPRYRTTIRNSWANRADFRKCIKGDRSEIKTFLRNAIPFSENSTRNHYLKRFEAKAIPHKDTKIFFFTRLWDPGIASSYSSQNVDLDGSDVKDRIQAKKEEYAAISKLRASIVKALKQEYGSSFIGGLAPTDYAIRTYPDLVGTTEMARRTKYTANMHRADICVNTQGTHGCYNFSFGEELAASRAIVTEKPIYQTPPFLHEGVNYYTYTSVDECLQKVAFLFEHPAAMLEMMQKNESYYQEHLRPDRLVHDTLDFALR